MDIQGKTKITVFPQKNSLPSNNQAFIELFTTEWLQKQDLFFFYSFFYGNVHLFHFYLYRLVL